MFNETELLSAAHNYGDLAEQQLPRTLDNDPSFRDSADPAKKMGTSVLVLGDYAVIQGLST